MMAREPTPAARLVDRDWFSAATPDEALCSACEPAIAGAFETLRGGEAQGSDASRGDAHASYVRKLRERESRRSGAPCTAVWLAGAVAYRCRTCQTGEQSSVCVACFRAGNLHEGHDTVVYRSETGGACDCGDVEAWSLAGCCRAHRPSVRAETRARRRTRRLERSGRDDDDESRASPRDGAGEARARLVAYDDDSLDDSDASGDDDSDDSRSSAGGGRRRRLRDAQTATFGVVFERLLFALESVAHARGPTRPVPAGARFAEEKRIAEALMRWVTREAEAGAPLRRAAARALTADWEPPSDKAGLEGSPSDGDLSEPSGTNKKQSGNAFAFPNAPYPCGSLSVMEPAPYGANGDGHASLETFLDANAVRAELRRRRVALKARFGNAPREPDWPVGGIAGCGLLECLLRASCLFSLPETLMEQGTTLLLTLLFVPAFKRTFGAALVRHYDAAARFPETLPWPGVANPARTEAAASVLEFPEAAYVAASPTTARDASNVNTGRFTLVEEPEDEDEDDFLTTRAGSPSTPSPSRALTAYASRRAATSRCLDRVTVQLFGAAPAVAVPATRDALLRATVETLERCVVGRHPSNARGSTAIRVDDADASTDASTDLTYRAPSRSFDPGDEAATHRLFARPCNDLRMLLSRRDAARRWARGGARSPFFRSAIRTLTALSGMHAHSYKTGEHVRSESRAWIEAVTAETFVNSTFRAGLACVGDGLASDKSFFRRNPATETATETETGRSTRQFETTSEDVAVLLDARDALLDACEDWHASFLNRENERARRSMTESADGSLVRRLEDLHASPVSAHVPLHRLWAVAAHWAAAARASVSSAEETLSDEIKARVPFAAPATRRAICRQAVHPLRALAFADQAAHRVWVRNGEEIRRAAAVYGSRYAAGLGRDADFGFAQMAMVAFVESASDQSAQNAREPEEETVDVVRFALAVGSAGAVAPKRENASAFPFPFPFPSPREEERGDARVDASASHRTTLGSAFAGGGGSEAEAEATGQDDDSARRVYPDPDSLPTGALACARSTARFLVSLTRDRAWLRAESFDARCRREVAHQLAARPRGVAFSALCERLPTSVAAESADVDETLHEVARRKVASGAGVDAPSGVSYALRDDVWYSGKGGFDENGFDAFFHRYSRGEHDAALAEATRLWVRAANSEKSGAEGTTESTFAWSPAALLRAPPAPPEPFGRLLLFTRHVGLATFARDALCFLRERPDCADLQDLGISAMALVKAALDAEGDAPRGDANSERQFRASAAKRFDRETYLSALFASPATFSRETNVGEDVDATRAPIDEKRRSDGSRVVPYVVECLDALAASSRAAGATWWREEDSHASVLVPECASLLARDLREAVGLPATSSAEARADRTADETMADAEGADAAADPEEDARLARARLAKARQAEALAAMAARQKAFADGCGFPGGVDDGSTDEDDGGGGDDGNDASRRMTAAETKYADASAADVRREKKGATRAPRLPWETVPECALCGDAEFGPNASSSAGQLCWLARRQRAFAPAAGRARAERQKRERAFSRDSGDSDEGEGEGEGEGAASKENLRALADSADALECVGFLPVTCGHGAHAACLDRYVRSTHALHETEIDEAADQAETDPESRREASREASTGLGGAEFRCPACRRVCDCVLPALAATPSQTERAETRDAPSDPPRERSQAFDRASSVEAALVATVNALRRGASDDVATRDDVVTRDDEKDGKDASSRVFAALAAPFAEPPRSGSVAVFGGSFVRSAEDKDTETGSFETDPDTSNPPRDWLKVAQIVATLDAQRRVRNGPHASSKRERDGGGEETQIREGDSPHRDPSAQKNAVSGSAEAVSAGLWRGAREIARRATSRGSEKRGSGVFVVARRSLAAALSRALARNRGKPPPFVTDATEAPLRRPTGDPSGFSVLAFGAQVEAQAVRRFEWDAVRRRRRRSSFSRFGTPGRRVRDGTDVFDSADIDGSEPERFEDHLEDHLEDDHLEDESAARLRGLFLGAGGDDEDPDALVAETAAFDREEGSGAADALVSENASGVDPSRMTTRKHEGEGRSDGTSLFRGGDAFFLKHHPFGFLVELLARADAFEPGVFAAAGGADKAEAFARAVFFAAARDAVEAARAFLFPRAGRTDVAGFPATTEAEALRLASSSPLLERTAWQVDALLAILRGEPFDATTVFERGVAVDKRRRGDTQTSACVSRLSSRLFRAPFEGVRFFDDARDASVADDIADRRGFSLSAFWEPNDPLRFVPPAFDRSALPRRHEDALAKYAEATCERCDRTPRDPAVCLACGAVMCCADPSCAEREPSEQTPSVKTKRKDARDAARDERVLARFVSKKPSRAPGGEGAGDEKNAEAEKTDAKESADDERSSRREPFFLYDARRGKKTYGSLSDAAVFEDAGACSAHASRRACGGGSCCFLLLKSTRVLILHSAGRRACLFPSPYVDAHGEEDEHMRRGRPLFLDEARARLLETLWASGALEHDSRATGASRLGGEWY